MTWVERILVTLKKAEDDGNDGDDGWVSGADHVGLCCVMTSRINQKLGAVMKEGRKERREGGKKGGKPARSATSFHSNTVYGDEEKELSFLSLVLTYTKLALISIRSELLP